MTLRLPATADAPAFARHALDGLEVYVGEQICQIVQLLVSELVTNSVRHGGLRPADSIEVDVRSTHDRVHVEVADRGRGFDVPDDLPPPGVGAEAGWGLTLTDRLATRWGARREPQTRVWFDVGRAPETADRRGSIGASV